MDNRDESVRGRLRPEDIEMIGVQCANGTCPAVYRSARGTVVVQGYAVGPADIGIDVGSGEQLVEIPEEVLLAAAADVQERKRQG